MASDHSMEILVGDDESDASPSTMEGGKVKRSGSGGESRRDLPHPRSPPKLSKRHSSGRLRDKKKSKRASRRTAPRVHLSKSSSTNSLASLEKPPPSKPPPAPPVSTLPLTSPKAQAPPNPLPAATARGGNDDDDDELANCTLTELVEAVTAPKPAHSTIFVLLLTLRSICTPFELVQEIILRFESCESHPQASIIRLRCVSLIRTWMDKHWFDFSKDLEVLTSALVDWSTQVRSDPKYSSVTKAVSGCIDRLIKLSKNPPRRHNVSRLDILEAPIPLTAPFGESGEVSLLQIHPEELCRQMCLKDEELWHAIEPWELLGQAWTKANKEEKSPNVLKMINHFNQMNRWVQAELLTELNLTTRIMKLKYFLATATLLIQNNNFNSCLEIVSALNSSSVYRLTSTFEGLTDKERLEFERLKEIVSRELNYSNMRALLRTCTPPAIPYLGMYLTDLIFLEDGSKDFNEDGLITFSKRRRVAAVIRLIQQLQGDRYAFELSEEVINYVDTVPVYDDDTNYEISLFISPRGGGEPVVPRHPDIKECILPPTFKIGAQKRKKAKLVKGKLKGNMTARRYGQSALSGEADDASESAGVVDSDSSFEDLVKRVIARKLDKELASQFLITYRSFCSSLELMNAIIKRFFAVVAGPETDHILLETCLDLFRLWRNDFSADFLRSVTVLVARFSEFCTEVAANENVSGRVKQELNAVSEHIYNSSASMIPVESIAPAASIVPSGPIRFVTDIHPTELARQMCSTDSDVFRDLRTWEFLDMQWTLPSSDRVAPLLTALLHRVDSVTGWVQTTILTRESSSDRKKTVKYWFSVCSSLHQLRDFLSLGAIVQALTSPAISRLKKVWSALSKQSRQLSELATLYSKDDYSKNILTAMRTSILPAIPFLPPFLEELEMLEKSHVLLGNRPTGDLINFGKHQEVATIIMAVFRFQNVTHSVNPIPSVLQYLKECPYYDAQTLMKLSHYLEPNTGSNKHLPRPVELLKASDRVAQGLFFSDEEWWDFFQVQLKDDYPFNQRDTKDNISFEMINGRNVLVAASLEKLIERICICPGAEVSAELFLMVYSNFCTAEELLDKLIARYQLPSPTLADSKKWDLYSEHVVKKIQNSATLLLKLWANSSKKELREPGIRGKLEDFMSENLSSTHSSRAIEIRLALESKSDPEDLIPIQSPSPTSSIVDYSTTEVADVICSMAFHLFKMIPPSELFYTAYLTPSRSPHLHSLLADGERLRLTILRDVTLSPDPSHCYKEWFAVAIHLKKKKNFHSYWYCLTSLVQLAPLVELPSQVVYLLRQARHLLGSKNAFKSLVFKTSQVPPAIPLLSIITDELKYLETVRHSEAFLQTTPSSPKLLNYIRVSDIASFLKPYFFRLQTLPYGNISNFEVKDWLLTVPTPPQQKVLLDDSMTPLAHRAKLFHQYCSDSLASTSTGSEEDPSTSESSVSSTTSAATHSARAPPSSSNTHPSSSSSSSKKKISVRTSPKVHSKHSSPSPSSSTRISSTGSRSRKAFLASRVHRSSSSRSSGSARGSRTLSRDNFSDGSSDDRDSRDGGDSDSGFSDSPTVPRAISATSFPIMDSDAAPAGTCTGSDHSGGSERDPTLFISPFADFDSSPPSLPSSKPKPPTRTHTRSPTITSASPTTSAKLSSHARSLSSGMPSTTSRATFANPNAITSASGSPLLSKSLSKPSHLPPPSALSSPFSDLSVPSSSVVSFSPTTSGASSTSTSSTLSLFDNPFASPRLPQPSATTFSPLASSAPVVSQPAGAELPTPLEMSLPAAVGSDTDVGTDTDE